MLEALTAQGWDWAIIGGAGVLAGLINGVVGSGTLISFPLLLLMGYPPLVANISNNIGLVPGSLVAAMPYRATLVRNRALIAKMIPLTVLGSLIGGLLLVALPGSVFDAVVPVLIAAALALVIVQPIIQPRLARRLPIDTGESVLTRLKLGLPLIIGLPLLAAYGGYFGAAQGILLLVILGLVLNLPFREVNGFKNLLATIANFVSGVLFVIVGPQFVDWLVVVCIAVGSTIGGMVGGRAAKLLPQNVYRVAIVVVGLAALWVTLAR